MVKDNPLACALLGFVLAGGAGEAIVSADALPARTALDDYVSAEDSSYSWTVRRKISRAGLSVYLIDMTSQTWRKPSEVSRIRWEHSLTIVRPETSTSDGALLLIGGGSNDREPRDTPDERAVALAVASGAVVAELGMVPNQPLAFGEDGRPRWEDDLIAHTWNKYVETGDPTWVARMPMVKAAVRAMDTVQACLAQEANGGLKIRKFVVAGGSKRGWTTWLTGAVDDRVMAIVPIVIDVLNVVPSMEHHYAAYGFWAPAVGDYERNGIMEKRFRPEYQDLMRLVDPYFYRHRLTMPKFIVNASGDQFFLPDSSRFYFDDLQGEKYLRYVPNSDHSLRGTDALESIQAFFQAVIEGRPRPRFSWSFEENGSIAVRTGDPPLAVKLWQATNPDARDFRLEEIGPVWTDRDLERAADGYVARVRPPAKGWIAFFVELTFASAGENPFKFTTAVRVLPDTLPFREKAEAERRAARGN